MTTRDGVDFSPLRYLSSTTRKREYRYRSIPGADVCRPGNFGIGTAADRASRLRAHLSIRTSDPQELDLVDRSRRLSPSGCLPCASHVLESDPDWAVRACLHLFLHESCDPKSPSSSGFPICPDSAPTLELVRNRCNMQKTLQKVV